MRVLLSLIALVTVLALAPQVQGSPSAVNGCLDSTTATGLRGARIVDGLGLTPVQIREVRARLATSDSGRNLDLAGIGLTAAQIRGIRRRVAIQVAAMNKYPLGWPCAPFKNAPLVIKYMKAKLLANGFRPTMQFFIKSPRQIQFVAIQDGLRYYGAVAKSGPRQIMVGLSTATASGGTYKFNVGFEA